MDSHEQKPIEPSPADTLHEWNARQRRRAVIAWIGGVLSVLLLSIECRLGVLHPASLLLLLLIALTFAPGLIALAAEVRRLARSQRVAALWTVAAVVPAVIWIIWGTYAYREFQSRENPRNLPMRLIQMAGASVMESRAVYLFPHRIETPRLIMFYGDGIPDPQRDAAEMDQHVARMEALTGLHSRTKIFLVRGAIFGGRHVAFQGLAFGSSDGHAGLGPADDTGGRVG